MAITRPACVSHLEQQIKYHLNLCKKTKDWPALHGAEMSERMLNQHARDTRRSDASSRKYVSGVAFASAPSARATATTVLGLTN